MTATIVLPVKQKYLIGIGAAIAAGCQPCTMSFADAASKAGACERGVRFAIDSGLAAREAATAGMAAFAGESLPHPDIDAAFRAERTTLDALIAVAAAVAGNVASRVEVTVAHAREVGATDDQIRVAADVARTAKRRAEQEADAALDAALGHQASSVCSARCASDSVPVCSCK